MAKKLVLSFPSDVEFEVEDVEIDNGDVATWTSKSGKTKPVSDIKTANLKAIERKLRNKGLDDLGIYVAITEELEERGER